jgi:molybdate transport system substrate-binding protein
MRPAVLIGLFALLVACGSSGTAARRPTPAAPAAGPESSLTVFAAASLTDAFLELGQAFQESNRGVQVVFNFAGSQRLALQLEQGARADVFAAADTQTMDRAVAEGLVSKDAVRIFAHNQLTVILPAANPGEIESLKDLARPGLRLVLAAEAAPVGSYSRQALSRMETDPPLGPGYAAAVLANMASEEENVKQVVAKVLLGEADAGMVYHTDITPANRDQLMEIPIPPHLNVQAEYPLAVLEAAVAPRLAASFREYVLSPSGQRILLRWGFMGIQP